MLNTNSRRFLEPYRKMAWRGRCCGPDRRRRRRERPCRRSTPAHARTALHDAAASGVPSFADVIERVKPAVVSVKVKVQNAAPASGDDGEDGQQFSMPDLPPGSPMERFFRQFRDQSSRPAGRPVSQERRASSARRRAPASSSRPTAMS